MPPGAQTAQGSQPFHLDLNSGLRTPLFISLFFLLRCHQQSEVWGALISRVCGASFYSIRELRAAGERLRESLARNLLATTLQGWTPLHPPPPLLFPILLVFFSASHFQAG